MEKTKILIVEDEAIIAMEIESQMQSLGYEITSIVDTGEKAIKKAEEDKPDIILMDIRIKGEMDGIATAEIIRNQFSIPVIFSTAYLDEERIERAKITMPFGYVLKPIQERDLKVTLEMALYVSRVDHQRTKAEELLKESEAKFRMLFESSNELITIADENANPIIVNPAWIKVFGPLADFDANPFDLIHIDDLEAVRNAWSQLISNGYSFDNLEYRYKDQTSTWKTFSTSAKRVKLKGKEYIYIVANDITRRKRAEVDLREKEEKFRLLYERAPLSYQSLNEDGYFIEINDEWLKTLGYTREEVIGKPFSDFIHPDWADHFKDNFPRFKNKGEILDVEFNMMKKDGSLVLVSFNGKIGYDDEGQFKQTHCIFKDITRQKRAEEEILQSKILLESSIESLEDMIVLSLDREYRYLYFNKNHAESMVQIYGTQISVGDCIFDHMTSEDDIEKVKSHYDQAMAGEGHVAIEEYGDDQLRYYYEIRYNPIYNYKKEIIGVTAFAGNITERKISEDKLKESENRFQDLALCSGDWIWEVDINGKYTYVSKKIEKILGYNPDEIIGKTPFDLMPKEEAVRVGEIFQMISSKKKPIVDMENWNLTKDGKEVCLLTNGIPMQDDDGNFLGYRGVDKDITAFKNTENLTPPIG
jgi:PAS domain S-box-containing protein